jgi:hypothetical protein
LRRRRLSGSNVKLKTDMKKINLMSALLIVYLTVMGVIGWPGDKASAYYRQYFIIMGISLAAILLLRFVQIRRMKWRNKKKENRQ